MADTVVPISLRCTLCNKPFDKQSTLKRHGYYCRSRNSHTRAVRVRSCVACAKAKARCDGRSLSCTRCATRNIVCRPQADKNSGESLRTVADKELQSVQRSSRQEFSSLCPFGISQSAELDAILNESESAPVDLDFSSIGIDDLDWNLLDTNMGLLENLDNQPFYSGLLDSSSQAPSGQRNRSISSNDRTRSTISAQSSIPSMPSYSLRSFVKKYSTVGPSQTTAMMMVHILLSFPITMRSQDALPPFIHPSYLSRNEESGYKKFEALSTCMSLVQMIGTNAPGSRKLFWKNVRMECERLQAEWDNLDKWALQAAMQALLIYMLLRLQEGETPDNNFDYFLLSTLFTVAGALIQKFSAIRCGPQGFSYGTTHDDWVFEESRRRLSLAFTALSMLFSLEPGGMCPVRDGFFLSPLPAKKQLWEARDENQWMSEMSRDFAGPSSFGIMLNGHMVKLDEENSRCRGETVVARPDAASESSQNWQEWCSGVDGLGSLVMLAVSLAKLHL